MPTSRVQRIALFCFAFVTAVFTLSGLVGHINRKKPAAVYTYIDNDYPAILPIHLDTVELEFYESERYVLNDTFADRVWDSTNSESGGFVRLGPDMRVFSIAMFHQLHCISRLQQGLKSNDGSGGQYHHIQHCLNYLRQLFLCSADATLEPGDVLERAREGDKDGTAFVRECRDWSAVYEFSDRNLIEFRQFRAANGSV